MRNLLLVIFSLFTFSSHSCLILFLSDGDNVLVANHEDWFATNSAVRFIPSNEHRYASIIFTFEDEGWAQGGINEHGLFFDAVKTPFQEVSFEEGSEHSPDYLWQMVLDKCKNVSEALTLISNFKIEELEEAHIVLADASGNSALIGVENGKLTIKTEDKVLLQTNFNPWHPELSDTPSCDRYARAMSIIDSTDSISESLMLNVLKNTHQDSLTVYSNIYDLKNKKITLYHQRDFDNPIILSFDKMPQSDCMIPISDFRNQILADHCNPSNSVLLNGIVVDGNDNALPFVNIGIKGTDKGTISDPDGSFVLNLSTEYLEDSIIFSSIGYGVRKMKVSELQNITKVELNEKIDVLDEVVVEEKKHFKSQRLGYVKGRDGVLPFDTVQGGGAVALMLESPKKGFYLDKVQFRLMYNSKDTSIFRLHMFDYDSICDCPGKELLKEEIMLTSDKRFDWMRYDLEEKDIFINEKKFFVGFEWIDDRITREKMLSGLRSWEKWKREEFNKENDKVERVHSKQPDGSDWIYYKYHGNMMNWPGWDELPPFTGLMVETGKHEKTAELRTFERKTSFSPWIEKSVTLNAVVVVSY